MEFVCGLQNVGNTCYMNSVLQTIIHNNSLRSYLMSGSFENELINNIKQKYQKIVIKQKRTGTLTQQEQNVQMNETLTYQLYKLLSTMKSNDVTSPRIFKDLIGKKNDMFRGFTQNDCHELLIFVLDCIHEETKSNVQIIYSGCPIEYKEIASLKEKISKLISGASSEKEKLDIQRSYASYEMEHQREMSVYNAVEQWSNYIKTNYSVITEYLVGMYQSIITCGNCGYISHKYENFTTISLEIPLSNDTVSLYDCFDSFTCPEFLDNENKYECSHCNRKTIGKKNIIIWYTPKTLIIHLKRFKYTDTGCKKINTNVSYPFVLDISKYVSPYKRQNDKYALTSVIHHYGQFGGGHYTAFSNVDNVGWLEFNDSSVSKINNTHLNQIMLTHDSYVLFYVKT